MYKQKQMLTRYGYQILKKCPDRLDTRSCSGGAYTDSGKSFGHVDIPLTPCRTHYTLFENIAPLSE